MATSKLPTPFVPPDHVREVYLRMLPQQARRSLELLFSLRGCMQRVNGDLFRYLGPDALSPGRMQVLIMLWVMRKPVRQTDLVSTLGVSRASMSELLGTMTREGLVVRRPDDTHGRRVLIELTDEGRQATDHLIRDNTDRLRATFADLNDGEQQQLVSLLDRLCVSAPEATDPEKARG